MVKKNPKVTQLSNDPWVKLSIFLRLLLASLIGLFISGVAMTAIGQPTISHTLSHNGNIFWHVILGFHLAFLTVLTISALCVLLIIITKLKSLKVRALVGIIVIIFGIVSGTLVLHKIHPGIFLFCMALAFLLIGAVYGPLAGHGRKKR
jgi:hypothetical protein